MAQDYRSQTCVFGLEGMDIQTSPEKLPETRLVTMKNIRRNQTGNITGRVGQALLASADMSPYIGSQRIDEFSRMPEVSSGLNNIERMRFATFGFGIYQSASIHSIIRLNRVVDNSYIRFLGIGSFLGATNTGAIVVIDDGYSGDPLSMISYRPPLAAGTYCYIGDSLKNRKVPADAAGTVTPIGLPKPGAITTALDTKKSVTIDNMDSAAGWVANAGTGAAGSIATTGGPTGGTATEFTTAPGGAPASGYYNFFNKTGLTIDLSTFGGGVDADDADLMHLWIRADRPDRIEEIRVYIIIASATSTTVLPGVDATSNRDAYLKVFRASDLTGFYEVTDPAITASETVNTNTQTQQQLQTTIDTRSGEVAIVTSQQDASRIAGLQLTPGRNTWTEYGIIGLPLKRGDFKRIGNDTARSWANVTGLCIAVLTNTNQVVNVAFEDFNLTGGSGLDSSTPGNIKYDYRVTNYNPTTGVESNGSDEQATTDTLDSLRRAIVVDPPAYGDSDIRQRIYRRGGSLVSNWYFCGTNSSDGAAFTDDLTDSEIVNAGVLPTDHDQPVTTVDLNGDTVYAQPVHTLWGPLNDLIFACGDPYRPGFAYWCKRGEPDHWPAANNVEVCNPSEELMGGVILSGQSFALSREAIYNLVTNTISSESVVANPTACKKGVVSRTAYCVGNGNIFFVNKAGIFAFSGGSDAQDMTEERLRPIFSAESTAAYNIDWNFPQTIRLEIHDDELWFKYQSQSGVIVIFIWNFEQEYWREYSFAYPPAVIYSEPGVVPSSLLFGSNSGTTVYMLQHSGVLDVAASITCTGATGYLDQGIPRIKKQYGDVYFKCNRNGQTIVLSAVFENGSYVVSPAAIINSGTGIQTYLPNLADAGFGGVGEYGNPGPVIAENIQISFAWTLASGSHPIIYHGGPSFILIPESVQLRGTDWDPQGLLTDKYVKGVIIDCDTKNVAKPIAIQADGVTQTTITCTASGRKSLQFAWTRFRGRILRLKPTTAVDWVLYNYSWIFDEEPAQLTRWETNELDHGIAGWHFPVFAYITYESTASVNFRVVVIDQTGASVNFDYTLLSTAGLKTKAIVKFDSFKGVMFRYIFTSNTADSFYLYKPESYVYGHVWSTGQPFEVHPFGDDDRDNVRGLIDSSAAASRQGGGG